MWPGLGAVSNRELVLRRRNSQRPNHHRGQRVGKLALEHRAFAGDHSVMLRNFIRQETAGKYPEEEPASCLRNIPSNNRSSGVITLKSTCSAPRMCRICRSISSTRTSEPILRVPLYPANSSFSFSPGCHGVCPAQHPSRFGAFNIAADPGFQNKVHHAAVPPLRRGPRLVLILEIILSAELQQRKTVLRERHRLRRPSSEVTRVLSNTVFHTRYGMNTFIERSAMANAPLRFDRKFTDCCKRPLGKRQKNRRAFLLRCRQRSGQFTKVCDAIPEER